MLKCEIIQPIETRTTWEVVCPYCHETTYPDVDDDADNDTGKCEECDKTFKINIKQYLKQQREL